MRQPEPPLSGLKTRCYQCGVVLAVEQARRRAVDEDSGRVDVCQGCDEELAHERWLERETEKMTGNIVHQRKRLEWWIVALGAGVPITLIMVAWLALVCWVAFFN